MVKELIKKCLLKTFGGKTPEVKKLGTMTSIEVMALAHCEPGLELFPFHLYNGVVEGTVEFKGEIPLMKKVILIGHLYPSGVREQITEVKNHFSKKGWISDEEISFFEKNNYILGTEDVPAIFIIAPTLSKSEAKIVQINKKDPILFIKKNENEWIPVHSWNHSKTLNQKLVSLN